MLGRQMFSKLQKNNRSQKQALISVEMYTSTHFMLHNAGNMLNK